MAGNSADPGRSVASKVIAILHTFTNGTTYSLSEIARLAGLSVSTAYRLATELTHWEFLERTDDGQYRIGRHLKALGDRAAESPPSVQDHARQIMADLAAASGSATVRLGVLTGLEVTYIEKGPGSRPVSAFEEAVVPAHATAMGKALLAFSPADVVDMVIARGLKRYTPYTVTASERLRHSLAVTRLTRVAVARRELDPNTTTVAVPVFGAGGHVVAALEVRCDDTDDVRFVQPALIMAARCLSRALISHHGRTQAGGSSGLRPRAASTTPNGRPRR
jgi:DNA-binding IclR family transcriptional regulator